MHQSQSITWQKNTDLMQESVGDVSLENFHLSSAFAGLYEKPSPFPYLKYRAIKGRRRWTQFLKDWITLLLHPRRFRKQFAAAQNHTCFPTIVHFLPTLDAHAPPKFHVPFYTEYEGRKFNGIFLKCAEQFQSIDDILPQDKRQCICEIGGGFGAMAELLVKQWHPKIYCIIDLPETLHIAMLYLQSVFPGTLFDADEYCDGKQASTGTTIVLIHADDSHVLRNVAERIDLFINSNSFAEMQFDVVQEYFKLIESYSNVYLSNTNAPHWEGDHLYAGPETYPYSDRWNFLYKERQKFPQWRMNYQIISHLPS